MTYRITHKKYPPVTVSAVSPYLALALACEQWHVEMYEVSDCIDIERVSEAGA